MSFEMVKRNRRIECFKWYRKHIFLSSNEFLIRVELNKVKQDNGERKKNNDNRRFTKFGEVGKYDSLLGLFYFQVIVKFHGFLCFFSHLHESLVYSLGVFFLNPFNYYNTIDKMRHKIGTMCRWSFGFGPNSTHSSGKNIVIRWWFSGQCFCDGSAWIRDRS